MEERALRVPFVTIFTGTDSGVLLRVHLRTAFRHIPSRSAFGSHGRYRGDVRAGGRRSLFFSRWGLGAYGIPANYACPRSQLAGWVPTSDARSVLLVQRGTRLAPGPQPSCLHSPITAAPRGSAVQTPEFLPGFLASATTVPPKILLTLSLCKSF